MLRRVNLLDSLAWLYRLYRYIRVVSMKSTSTVLQFIAKRRDFPFYCPARLVVVLKLRFMWPTGAIIIVFCPPGVWMFLGIFGAPSKRTVHCSVGIYGLLHEVLHCRR